MKTICLQLLFYHLLLLYQLTRELNLKHKQFVMLLPTLLTHSESFRFMLLSKSSACLLTYLWHQSKLSHEHIIHSWAKQKLCPWNPITVHRSLLSLEGKFIWEKRTYKILVQNKTPCLFITNMTINY
jgi:hypothetical protein